MKIGKLPKVHLCCKKDNLRPAMNNIQITKEHIVAVNGFVIVVLDTTEIFSDDFIDGFPADEFYITRDNWQTMIAAKDLQWEGDIIKIVKSRGVLYVPINKEPSFKYPSWKNIIPDRNDLNPLDKIGINPQYLSDLNAALPYDTFKLHFKSQTSGILITDCSEEYKSYGMIMPLIIND